LQQGKSAALSPYVITKFFAVITFVTFLQFFAIPVLTIAIFMASPSKFI